MGEHSKGTIIACVVAGLAAVGMSVYGAILWSNNNQLAKQEKALLQQVNTLTETRKERERIIRQIEATRKTVSKLVEILPIGERVNQLMAKVTDQLKRFNLSLARWSHIQKTGSEEMARGYDRRQFKLSISGRWENFLKFTHWMETYTRFMKIDAFELKTKTPGPITGSAVVDIELTFSIYTYEQGR